MNMDEQIAFHLKMHADVERDETEKRAEQERRDAAERAGRKHLEHAQHEAFMRKFGFFLEMSRYHQAVQEESAAVKREAEMEANEREYWRAKGVSMPGDDYAGYTVDRSPLLRGVDTLRAKLGRG